VPAYTVRTVTLPANATYLITIIFSCSRR